VRFLGVVFVSTFVVVLQAPAQHQHGAHPDGGAGNASALLIQQASGTAFNPASTALDMLMTRRGPWHLMLHGQAFVADIQQTGPRGGDKFFSTNWVMGMAERRAGRGSAMFRAMLSLEPATITHRRYPQLFQTGETAFDEPIVNGQHPHELFMELSFQYARALGERTVANIYLAPVGEPALGPVAFPHRVSAMELPQAPLGHHLQDSTHIANDVITAGITHGPFRLEASGFHGKEPDEHRWNIDYGPIDSWAARLAFAPAANWSAQASVGRLESPEALEEGDIVRSTASLLYNRPFANGAWAAGLIWGRNHKTFTKQNLNSYLLESVLRFRAKNHLTGRVELLDREELFGHTHDVQPVFRIAAYTLGYTRDFDVIPGLRTGLGGNFTLYTVPAALKPLYGSRPAAFLFYLRLRPAEM
jgi:hypothetical protein